MLHVPGTCLLSSIQCEALLISMLDELSRITVQYKQHNVLHGHCSRQLIVHVLHSNGLSCLHKRIAITYCRNIDIIIFSMCMCLQLSYCVTKILFT